MINEISLKGWFDCLNAVAIELHYCAARFDVVETLIDVMEGAGITLEEIRWAREQEYKTLNDLNVLVAYEGILMEEEREEE